MGSNVLGREKRLSELTCGPGAVTLGVNVHYGKRLGIAHGMFAFTASGTCAPPDHTLLRLHLGLVETRPMLRHHLVAPE